MEALGIEIIELSAEKVVANMPVNEATRQPTVWTSARGSFSGLG